MAGKKRRGQPCEVQAEEKGLDRAHPPLPFRLDILMVKGSCLSTKQSKGIKPEEGLRVALGK
jgi:hypothetical protein